MRKTVLTVLSAAALVMAVPQLAAATPATNGAALKTANESLSPFESAYYYGYYRRPYYGYYHRRHYGYYPYYRYYARPYYRGYYGYGYGGW